MPTLAEIRQQYPQYEDMSDTALADALHGKFYSDIPRGEFDAKIGLTKGPQDVSGSRRGAPLTQDQAAPGSEEAIALEQINARGPAPDDLKARGGLLPIGKTQDGEVVPALPEFLHGPKQTIMDLIEGKRTSDQLSGKEIFELGSLFAGGAPKVAAEAGGSSLAGGVKAVDDFLFGEKKPASAAAPVAEKLTPSETHAAAARSVYKEVDEAGVVLKSESVRPVATDIAQTLAKEGLDPTLHPRTTAALKRIAEVADEPLSFQTLETLRRVANAAGKTLDPDEGRLAGIIKDKIDDFVEKLSDKDVFTGAQGDAAKAAGLITKARELWSKSAKLDVVETLVDRAMTSAPNFSASGFENALRTEFRALAKNKRLMRTFTKQEQKAIKRVARGTVGSNAARNIGRFAPTGPVSGGVTGGLTVGATSVGGPLLGAAVGGTLIAGGFAARKLATILMQRHIKQLEAVILAGGDRASAKAALTSAKSKLQLLLKAEPVAASAAAASQDNRRKK